MLQLTRLRTNVSPACYPAPSPNPVAPYLIQNVRDNCVTHFAAGATLYCEHDAADQIYQVITGVVRTVTITRDGKRALRGFHVPGEIFGIECARTYRASAEAVCDARVLRRDGSITERTLTSDEVLTRHLWNSVLQISKRAEDLSLLGRASALEKLSYFLLDLAERLGTMPAVQLPMSRQDIADYLGISSETVSRAFTVLSQKKLLATRGRSIVLLDPKMLFKLRGPFYRGLQAAPHVPPPAHCRRRMAHASMRELDPTDGTARRERQTITC